MFCLRFEPSLLYCGLMWVRDWEVSLGTARASTPRREATEFVARLMGPGATVRPVLHLLICFVPALSIRVSLRGRAVPVEACPCDTHSTSATPCNSSGPTTRDWRANERRSWN